MSPSMKQPVLPRSESIILDASWGRMLVVEIFPSCYVFLKIRFGHPKHGWHNERPGPILV